MQVTAWRFFLIEWQQIAALHRDLGQQLFFFFRTVAPVDAIGLTHRRNAFNPILNMRIRRNRSCYITHGISMHPFLIDWERLTNRPNRASETASQSSSKMAISFTFGKESYPIY